MANTIQLSKEELDEILDTGTEVETRPWRWGTEVRLVFERDGKHWATWVRCQPDEGAMTDCGGVAIEVNKAIRTVETWEPVT